MQTYPYWISFAAYPAPFDNFSKLLKSNRALSHAAYKPESKKLKALFTFNF
jgi:hypothetical protein